MEPWNKYIQKQKRSAGRMTSSWHQSFAFDTMSESRAGWRWWRHTMKMTRVREENESKAYRHGWRCRASETPGSHVIGSAWHSAHAVCVCVCVCVCVSWSARLSSILSHHPPFVPWPLWAERRRLSAEASCTCGSHDLDPPTQRCPWTHSGSRWARGPRTFEIAMRGLLRGSVETSGRLVESAVFMILIFN